jgi:hypothetical protein
LRQSIERTHAQRILQNEAKEIIWLLLLW